MQICHSDLPPVPFPLEICGDWIRTQVYALVNPQPIEPVLPRIAVRNEPVGVTKRFWDALTEEWQSMDELLDAVNKSGDYIDRKSARKVLYNLHHTWGVRKKGQGMYRL